MQLFILTAALFAGLSFSQNLTQIQDLPPCGQTCINNMLGMAASLGCATTDYKCLCTNMNFGYGVRDCSTSVCAAAKPPVDPSNIISVGNSFCSEANAASGSTSTLAQTVLTGTTSVTGSSSGMTSMPMATGSSSGGNGTSGGSTNGTSGGLLGGNVVTTLTNSLGSTTTSTISSSSSSGSGSGSSSSSSSGSGSTSSSSSSSGTGTATGATSPTASTKSEAGHVAAAGGLIGLAGLFAAWALL